LIERVHVQEEFDTDMPGIVADDDDDELTTFRLEEGDEPEP
jgi:hypothetical protein